MDMVGRFNSRPADPKLTQIQEDIHMRRPREVKN